MILAASGAGAKSEFDWLRKQFAALDIQLQVRSTDYNRFQEKVLKGDFQILRWGWNADYPDPENFLFLLYGPNGKVKSQGENAANYDNPRFDALFRQVENMTNSPERAALIQEMVTIAREDAPWIWGMHPVGYGLYHEWFHNAKPMRFGRNTLKYKRIDAQLRRERRARVEQTGDHAAVGGIGDSRCQRDSRNPRSLSSRTRSDARMIAYIVRRCLYAIPILIGVNVIVFLLFFFVNSPDDMARTHLGQKRVTPEQIDQWKREHSLDLPYFYNAGWRRIGAVVATKAENMRGVPHCRRGKLCADD